MKPPEADESTVPWYRQFWPWYLISLPAVAVIAGIATLVIAIQNRDFMVVDNYYKQGLAINRTLEQQQAAAILGLTAQASIDFQDHTLTLYLTKSYSGKDETLNLSFIHATLADQDHTIVLKKIRDTVYRGRMRAVRPGNWNLILQPSDALWRLDAHIRFPVQSWSFKPEV